MKVIVNEKYIILFDGAKVIDAIRKYKPEVIKIIMDDQMEVLDQYGNQVGLDGTLTENNRLFLRKK